MKLSSTTTDLNEALIHWIAWVLLIAVSYLGSIKFMKNWMVKMMFLILHQDKNTTLYVSIPQRQCHVSAVVRYTGITVHLLKKRWVRVSVSQMYQN